MPHHRDTGSQDALDRFLHFGAALQFDGMRSGFFHDTDRAG